MNETKASSFLIEELQLMSCYDTKKGLAALINQLQVALPHITDKLSADVTADCIDKLCRMSEEEYVALSAQFDPLVF